MKTPAASIEELNDVLAATPFLKPYGFMVKTCHPGECTIVVPFVASLERPGGILSGMTLMGAADVAMWLAVDAIRHDTDDLGFKMASEPRTSSPLWFCDSICRRTMS